MYEPYVFSLGPFTGVVNQMRILAVLCQVSQRSIFIFRSNPAKAQHIGLTHHDKHLNRFAHVCSLIVRVG